MNLLLHQFRKDVRHGRLLIALWLVLVVARFALVGWNADPDNYAIQRLYTMLSGLTTLLGFVLIVVLMPLVIHQEPLVGTNAFWFTRPISRFTLLGSKGLVALFLLLLPLVVQAIVFAANGVTAHDLVLAVPELALEQGAWMITVSVLAVLTPGAGRFAIVAAVLLVVFLVFMVLIQTFENFLMFERNGLPASLTNSRFVAACVLLIGFGAGAIIHQYLTRRTAGSIVLAVLAIGLYSAAVEFWTWNFLKPDNVVVADTKFDAKSIGTPILTSVNIIDRSRYDAGSPGKQVRGEITLPDCPPGYLIKIEYVRSTLKTQKGVGIYVDGGSNLTSFSPPQFEPLTEALGGAHVMNLTQFYQSNPTALFDVNPADFNQALGKTLRYQGELQCVACKYVATGEVPVTTGAHFVQGSNRETISEVLQKGGASLTLSLQEQTIVLLFGPRPENENGLYAASQQNRVVYVLLNRKRNEAVVQRIDDYYGYSGSDQIISHHSSQLDFGSENNKPDRSRFPAFDEAWLRDAVLVRLELTRVAEFSRTLIVTDLRLDGTFRGPDLQPATASADLETLDRITLPPNANREQTRDYVRAILRASAHAGQVSDHDPQQGMLKQVGAQNVDLLIELARTNHNYYLNHAINDLAQADQREAILFALPTNPDLIDTIVAHHWEKQAEPALLTGLDPNSGRADSFALALVSLKDRTTYDALKAYYLARPDQRLFEELATLSGFDLKGMIDIAWQNHASRQIWEIRSMLGPALQFGEPGALDTALIFALLPEMDGYTRKMARAALAAYTPTIGASDDERVAWVKANKDHLVYDSTARKFVLKSPPLPVETHPSAPR